MKKNYYELLEVNQNASPEIIEKAYKVLVKKYHPDLQEAEKKAFFEQKLKEINEAYDILSNTEKRKQYDIELESIEKRKIENLYNENINLKNELNNIKDISKNNYYTSQNSNTKSYSTTNPNVNQNQNYNVNNNNQNYYNNTNNNKNNYQNATNIYYKKPKYKTDYNYKKLYYKSLLKIKFRHIITDIIAIIFIILTFFILWQIPFIRNYLTNLYNENIVIQTIVNFFKNIK